MMKVINTPPLGWNSWNTFTWEINEDLIKETVDTMVEKGYKDAGYEYVIIDDCWSLKERDENGRLVPDPKKFPNGMKAVADYIHAHGLKFGMYSCAGPLTCAGYPGSYEHEQIDAETFAEWEVDYLKYDFCFHSAAVTGPNLYRRMGVALANCGREILFSACSWGVCETAYWAKTIGAGAWRSTVDIMDNFNSIRKLALEQFNKHIYAGKGCFNDMDMLVVGMERTGNIDGDDHDDLNACGPTEYRTHFSFWALLNSPLIMGCDIRKVKEEYRVMMQNKEVLAINQDPAQGQAFEVYNNMQDPQGYNHPKENSTWAKYLANGDIAIGMFNFSDRESRNFITMESIGLPESCGKTVELLDVWSGEKIEVKNGIYMTGLKAHDCRLFRAKVINK